ncbi:MAG TPA: YicC/YloC family endoribonuclease [Bacteroidales bacterium]|nr:YicC/YloC family endoribonuclease [Bacteroidales bacterium]
MIQSMTGYGKSTYDLGDKTVIFEIKSLNSKQLDLYIRLPNGYREKEMDIRNEISSRIKRGKVEVNVSFEFREGKQATQINAAVVKDYYTQLKEIASEIGLSDHEPILQSILRMPEALNTDKQGVDPDESEKLMLSLKHAIDELDKYRSTEGAALASDISGRIGMIENYLQHIAPFENERTESIRNKLGNSLLDFIPQESIDKNRYEQELIYYLEKLDISEEKTRLKQHCKYFIEVMEESDQVGRKLGFVAQEIGREINTIGSKANHSGIQKLVVLMKDELEKIKEQLLNVL